MLGFAHEAEFEIIALCVGSTHCLELMTAYALTVLPGVVGLTLLLFAGYERHEERVEQYAPYLPVFSAVALVAMGLGFIIGLFWPGDSPLGGKKKSRADRAALPL